MKSWGMLNCTKLKPGTIVNVRTDTTARLTPGRLSTRILHGSALFLFYAITPHSKQGATIFGKRPKGSDRLVNGAFGTNGTPEWHQSNIHLCQWQIGEWCHFFQSIHWHQWAMTIIHLCQWSHHNSAICAT